MPIQISQLFYSWTFIICEWCPVQYCLPWEVENNMPNSYMSFDNIHIENLEKTTGVNEYGEEWYVNHYHSRRLCLCLRRRHCQREHRIAPPPLMMTGVPTRTSTPPLTTTTVLMATIAPMMSTMAPPPPTTNVLTKTSVSHITGCNSRLLSNIWYGRVKTMMQRHRIIQKIYNQSLLQHNCTRRSVVKIKDKKRHWQDSNLRGIDPIDF